MMSSQCLLTTFDNPFDPFSHFDEWLQFDKDNGYDSCERLMRIAKLTDDMTEGEVEDEIERAIDEIIAYDFTNTYKKVTKQSANEPEKQADSVES